MLRILAIIMSLIFLILAIATMASAKECMAAGNQVPSLIPPATKQFDRSLVKHPGYKMIREVDRKVKPVSV
jgi:hypothetical protein